MTATAFPIAIADHCAGVIEFFSHGISEPNPEVSAMFATVGGQLAQYLERGAGVDGTRRCSTPPRRRCWRWMPRATSCSPTRTPCCLRRSLEAELAAAPTGSDAAVPGGSATPCAPPCWAAGCAPITGGRRMVVAGY